MFCRGSGSERNTIAINTRCRKTFFYQRRPPSVAQGISHCFQGLQARTARPDRSVSGDIFSMTPVQDRWQLSGAAALRPQKLIIGVIFLWPR